MALLKRLADVWDGHAIGETTVAEFDGRIAMSGPTLAHSYLDDPERTARSFVEREGTRWYLSDDAGSVDERGRLTIQGRLDDVIVSGGVKVALGRIERLVHRDFSAPDAVVVGAEHETWGHVPVVVTTKNLDLTALRLGIGAELGPEARPDRVLTIPEIPLLPSGKPDRLALTALAGKATDGILWSVGEGARLRTLPLALAPVVLGSGSAVLAGAFDLGLVLLALVVALSLQIGVNYANDYSDGVRGTDDVRVGAREIDRIRGGGASSRQTCGLYLLWGGTGRRGSHHSDQWTVVVCPHWRVRGRCRLALHRRTQALWLRGAG